MPQHDMVIDNGPGLAVRTDINAAFQALVQNSSGPVEPPVMYPGQFWLDTSVAPNGQVRQRNQANTGWITPIVVDPNYGVVAQTVVSTSGTYTKPAGLRYLEVTVIGGGGGGTSSASTGAGVSSSGGGGGGAGVTIKLYAAASLAATTAMTIGAGGIAGGGIGASGGSSIFIGLTGGGGFGGGAILAATATAGQASAYGGGGSATGGTLNIHGGSGEQGMVNMHNRIGGGSQGGAGGGSMYAARTFARYWSSSGATGIDGEFPGGGAAGAGACQSMALQSGAVGGAGAILLKEFF